MSLPPQASAGADFVVRHWLLLANTALGVFVVMPWLAPLFMHLGWERAANAVYLVYSFFCHQLPERSWFLFGDRLSVSLGDLQRFGHLSDSVFHLRRFIGNAEVGWKVAWSDRMVSFYGGWFLFGLVYGFVRHRVQGLSWKAAALLMSPLAIDGLTHAISDLWGIGRGFRETNLWLAALSGHAFSPAFYGGDSWGSFNSLMRLGTGLLAAFGLIFFLFPLVDRAMRAARANA